MKTVDDVHNELERLFQNGYIDTNQEPIKCEQCQGTDFTDKVVDTIQGYTSEKERFCKSCNNSCGYWAYGYWQI